MRQWGRKVKESNPLRNRKFIAIGLYILCFVLFFSVFFRFTWIMVKGEVNGEDLEQNVENLYTRNNTLQAKRGSIYDTNGNPIAVDATTYKMVAVLTDEWSTPNRPIHIKEPEKVASILSDYVSMSEEELYERLTKENSQVEFGSAGNNLTFETKSAIEEALKEEELTGITFEEKQSRLYPNGTFASHSVGLAQQNNEEENEITGVLGIEKEYNDSLSGKNGWRRYQRDRFGYVLPDMEVEEELPVNGNDLYLTLDRRMQIFLESIIDEVDAEHNPANLTATLMHAKTGEIVATSQRPTFNATTKEGIEQSWQNLLVEFTYEPGSTLKVITLASAIQEGIFRPYDYFKSGQIQIAGETVRDVNPRGWGNITYLEGLARSSNVAFVKLVEEMGHDTWKEYLDDFGFGEPTGISLPNEMSGSNPYQWPIQRLNTSFGQGLTVTPIQMLRAFSAIANDGKMVDPHLVKSISDPDTGEVKNFEQKETQTLISEEAADKTLEYLKETVYSDEGNARGYQIEGHEIVAKTGTAQFVNPETGTYHRGGTNYIYSVVGMAPADDPELIFYITMQQPELNGLGHASQVIQKIFNPVMKRALEYFSPDEEMALDEEESETLENTVQSQTSDIIQQFEEKNREYSIIGSGDTIVQQFPAADTEINDSYRILLLTNGAMTLPDLTGWSRSDVLRLADLTGIEVEFEGEGYVTDQSILPDSFIETGSTVAVKLTPPNDPHHE